MTARKVNELDILKRLSSGERGAHIARDYTEKGIKVTRQAIGLYKPLLINIEQLSQGKFSKKFHKLTDAEATSLLQSAGRQMVAVQVNGRKPTWDEVREFLLNSIELAAQVPELQKELAETKRELKSSKHRKDDELRYERAVQQGEIPPPLSRTKKNNLTYHIPLYEPDSLFILPDLSNIMFIDGQPTANFMLASNMTLELLSSDVDSDIVVGWKEVVKNAEVFDKTICWQGEGNPGLSQFNWQIRPQDYGLS